MGNAEDWAASLAKKLVTKRQEEDRQAQIVAMNREIEAEGMPRIWKDLMAAFQKSCDAFNSSVTPDRPLACHALGPHHFIVRPDALPEIVTGDYDPETRCIIIRSRAGEETFCGQIVHEGAGKLQLASIKQGCVVSLEGIARKAIEAWAL